MTTDIYFGDYKLPSLISYSADRECRNTKKEYNADGDLLIDMVSRKLKLTLSLGRLTSEQMKEIQTATQPVFFPVTFFDPLKGETSTAYFHLSEQPAQLVPSGGGGAFDSLKLVLEEK